MAVHLDGGKHEETLTPERMNATLQESSQTSSQQHLSERTYILRSSCPKHFNHALYVPVSQLMACQTTTVGHVSMEILETILNLAHWVVRVRVLNTKAAGAAGAGKYARTCAGLVTSIGEHCVTVQVPFHVVHDTEAQHIIADFFYDSNNCSDVITIRGLSLNCDSLNHTAQLTCQSCPELRQRFQSFVTPGQWYPSMVKSLELDSVQSMEESVAVLISHPHGFSKMVSFGRYRGTEVQVERETALKSRTSDSVQLSSLPLSCTSTFSMFRKCSELVRHVLFTKLQNAAVLMLCTIVGVFQTIVSFIHASLNRFHITHQPHCVPHNGVRVYHDAASCPGSSGGALLLIGQQAWTEVVMGLRLFPVVLHVGMVIDRDQGVAVPVVAADGSIELMC